MYECSEGPLGFPIKKLYTHPSQVQEKQNMKTSSESENLKN